MCRKFDQAVYEFCCHASLAIQYGTDHTNELEKVLFTMKELLAKSKAFVPPTPFEVDAYCLDMKKGMVGHEFCDFYESKGWMVGKNKMKSWEAAVRNWCKKDKPLQMPTESPEQRLKRMEQYL